MKSPLLGNDVTQLYLLARYRPCLLGAEPTVVTDLPSDMLSDIGPAITVFSGSEIMTAIRKS
jgi:hypothetical protein